MAAARWLLPWIKTQVRISSRSATGYTFPYLRLLEISFEYSGFWESVAHFWISAWLTPMIAFTEIKGEIKSFLRDSLKLTLSEEKTHITNARTEEAFFLGTTLKIGNGGTAKVKQMTNWTGKTFKRRTTGWETVMKAPLPKLVKSLSERGFCTTEGEPTPKSGWAFLDAEQIVSLYSSVNRGIQNYYRFADNWGQLNRIQYILQCSLAKTLARKYQISMTK